MMSHRADEIRKRISKRKKERQPGVVRNFEKKGFTDIPYVSDEEKYGQVSLPAYEAGPENEKILHPLFRSDLFILKILLSACLVLFSAIVFKNNTFQPLQFYVHEALNEEFQFAAASKWYEEKFGSPLTVFQQGSDQSGKEVEQAQFSLPASGKVLESFEDNGHGIMVETNKTVVEAVNEGIVIEAGKKEETGLTVVLQHADGTESWYGNLEKVNVALYDFVQSKKEIGSIKQNETEKGTYYFAIKKGDTFVDPVQVTSIE